MEWLNLVLNLLSVVGGSAIVAAAIPMKYRQYLPVITRIIDIVGANVLGAKNQETR